jgi:hypothetical protein
MNVDVPTTDALTSFVGLTAITVVIVEVIMRALQPSAEKRDRFGPLLAIGIAVVIGVGAALYTNQDPVQAAITGLFAGLAAMGSYKAIKVAYEAGSG